MPDDINAELRLELEAALDVLDPQLRGLDDLTRVSITDPLLAEVRAQLTYRRHRSALIHTVLSEMDQVNAAMAALEADGYPELPDETLEPAKFAELQGQNADLDAAVGVFSAETPASNLNVDLGEVAQKPGA